MRNLMAVILTGFIATSLLYAKNDDNKINVSNIQEFYYNQGYKQGYNFGYNKGYNDAIRDVIARLKKYNKKMLAIEATKYLIANAKITYPEVYRIQKDDGSYEVIFTKPRVEKILTVKDLALIPLLKKNSDNNNLILTNTSSDSNNNYSNAFHLQNEDYLIKTPLKRTQDINKEICLKFPKLPLIKKILLNSGKPIIEEKNFYLIEFENKKELESFCKNIGGDICLKYAKK